MRFLIRYPSLNAFERSVRHMGRLGAGVLLGALLPIMTCSAQGRESGEGCYGYLTELVRSSNFPFLEVAKEKANLLIDEDDGETIRAKVFFDTQGTGTLGWVKYGVNDGSLLDITVDPEEPVVLRYDERFAQGYSKCLEQR
ncbi:lipoprotein, putative [Pseudomonas chlororaphis subsp. aureofaciens]|uniref:Lipoprotein, putative n=1 Tax=Pseudomonas chlororaphis subsp. aureofaciens TaxID=587851 RepID=A0AAD1EA19_9PSED|nr:hypothetical protein [Pseudomonas chlororaphis]AZE32914.1 lipoprotein, putative [Pseudomonas chlororaphis subsp. aureofaciens]AZE39220.1 lipoprotein, putative [Pseudomonas chlororaphis subsp. aureofaciens]AZE45558.1 lipoprotein, putative [Pseudomonas chlororaphis subsp. aureofaciens]